MASVFDVRQQEVYIDGPASSFFLTDRQCECPWVAPAHEGSQTPPGRASGGREGRPDDGLCRDM